MIDCDPFDQPEDHAEVRALIERHVEYTDSPKELKKAVADRYATERELVG